MAKRITVIILSISIAQIVAWIPDAKPNLSVRLPRKDPYPVFFGNTSDYFKLLDQDDDSILIGARNAVYNLSVTGLRENFKLEWSSSDADGELCALKGKQEKDCQNYIRVFARVNENQIMICGTNSYKPRCRTYARGVDEKYSEVVSEMEAQGRCPYNPQHNSTFVYTDGQLYSATVADFSGADPLIFRETLRTEQYDLKQLNQPDFVSAVERNGYVFIFFREIAMEYMNCGKAIYSRVGRICKNDRGGPYAFSDRWTSFLKTRLNCSVPGEYPFYFDEIQATSKIIDRLYSTVNRSSLIYAVFTTSVNAISGSAVCAFSIDDILDAFEGHFKAQRDNHANWLPVTENMPEPRPGKCVDDSRTLSSTSVNFVKTHTLMEQAVPAVYGRPLLTRVSLDQRLTAIAVDPNVITMDGNAYDVIFVGTDNGTVIKFINIPPNPLTGQELRTIVISEMQAFTHRMPVRELTISHKTESVIAVSDGHVISLPLHHCPEILQCWECLALQDPYCVWDINNHECKTLTSAKAASSRDGYIQDLNSTKSAATLCHKYGDYGNQIEKQHRPTVSQSTRGTASAIGKALAVNGVNPNGGGGAIDGGIGYEGDEALNEIGQFNSENKITLTLINPDDLINSLNDPQMRKDSLDGKRIHLANSNFYWGFAVAVMLLVFGIGILVGLYSSRRLCKTSPFHPEHRNQLSSKSRPNLGRNSGKDTNLLMKTNTFSTVTCNNKKDNLEHEFVGDKDRSHECKNSTENLEKEANCKTSTLTKVKRTYI